MSNLAPKSAWLYQLRWNRLYWGQHTFGVHSNGKRVAQSSFFCERFCSAFGRSAMEFLREVRIRKAAKLLYATDLPIKQISDKVRFASRSHFPHAFKNHFGQGLAGYRNERP